MSDSAEVADQLGAREPIFHRREFCSGPIDFDRMVATDFLEVGASGTVHDRAHVREVVLDRLSHPVPDPWEITEFEVRELGPSTYLATYLLKQGSRETPPFDNLAACRRAVGDRVSPGHDGRCTMIAEIPSR